MLLLKNNKPGRFKIGITRAQPNYLAEKLFDGKKEEEWFLTALYAKFLRQEYGCKVFNWHNSVDDSNKGPDAILSCEKGEISIQVTRFILTEYLTRRVVSKRLVNKLVDNILSKIRLKKPLNITIDPPNRDVITTCEPKIIEALSNEIIKVVKENYASLNQIGFFLHHVRNFSLKKYAYSFGIELIPDGLNSSFYGRDNLYINYDFDNVGYDEQDIQDAVTNMYNKKNNGKAEVLLIWIDKIEIVFDFQAIVDSLRSRFKESSFKEVLLFVFHNRIDTFFNEQFEVIGIK